MSSKNIPDKDHLDVKRRQMIDSFVQVGQAMRTCADTVQAFADASALANPTDIGSLLSILAAGHSLATNIGSGSAGAGGAHHDDDDGAKKKRKRTLKDPNAPKRPVTAYLQFQNEVKNEVQEENRDKAYKDILRLVAEKWKGLPDHVKQMYTDRHKRDMLVYEQRVQAYKNAIAEGRIPTTAATAFADVKDDFEVDEDEDDEIASQVAGEKSDSDDSESEDEEDKAPTPPPAKKSKPTSGRGKKAADEAAAPSSTPAAAEKKKDKKKKASE